MKKLVLFLLYSLFLVTALSCQKVDPNKLYDLKIQLLYPKESGFGPVAGVEVTAVAVESQIPYTGITDDNGMAVIPAVADLYTLYVSESRVRHGSAYFFDGFKPQVVLTHKYDKKPFVVDIDMAVSEGTQQVIIKELYFGGCIDFNGPPTFHQDKYLVLYNNSTIDADLSNICIAMTLPYDSYSPNTDIVGGKLSYEDAGKIPAGHGFWTWYDGYAPILKPGEDIVIAINGAVNHILAHSESVNLSKGTFYVMYDPESGYNDPSYYPMPSLTIPLPHYMKAYKYGEGDYWPLSETSPALFIFLPPEGVTPQSFFEDTSNEDYYNGMASGKRKWVPAEWVLDACEVFAAGYEGMNNKRLINSVDSGSLLFTNKRGYTLYRNVDEAATFANPSNYGKFFIRSYDKKADPTGIDAEHQIFCGDHIIFKNTNNSGEDFHQRLEPAIHMARY